MTRLGTLLCRLSFVALLCLSLQAPALAASVFVVDDFSEAIDVITLTSDPNPGILVMGIDPTPHPSSPDLNVLGGSRITSIATSPQAELEFDSATVTYVTNALPSFMDVNSSAGWSGAIGLWYDLANEPTALDEAVGVDIDLMAYDGPAAQNLRVTTSLCSSSGGCSSGPASFVGSGPQTLRVAFPSLAPGSTIDDMRVYFGVPGGGDFRVSEIRTVVPEPSTALLAGLGLAAMGLARRKR